MPQSLPAQRFGLRLLTNAAPKYSISMKGEGMRTLLQADCSSGGSDTRRHLIRSRGTVERIKLFPTTVVAAQRSNQPLGVFLRLEDTK